MAFGKYFKKLIWNIEEILFPRKCIFCGEVINEKKEIMVCNVCQKALPLDVSECCFEVIGKNAEYVISPFLYETDVRSAIIKFKFYSKERYGKTLAYFMNEELNEVCKSEKFDLIVPVPLHKKKLRKRGYNQAAVLAKELKANGAVYDEDILIKIKNKGTQSLKGALERAEAVKGCFVCIQGVEDKNILLVDDICTTGVTLNYCAGQLKKMGAKRVVCITAAKRYLDKNE